MQHPRSMPNELSRLWSCVPGHNAWFSRPPTAASGGGAKPRSELEPFVISDCQILCLIHA